MRARAAALLGRLSAQPSVLATLRERPHLQSLTAALASAAAPSGSLNGPLPSDSDAVVATPAASSSALLQDSLLRVIAGVAAPGESPGTAAAVAAAGGLREIVAVMRSQLASLLLPPAAPGAGRFFGLGNACKLLGALLDDAGAPLAAAFLGEGGVDVLVGALKLEGGSSDPQADAVRKNASVALARAVRDPACMARARELRGIEILVQLQMSK